LDRLLFAEHMPKEPRQKLLFAGLHLFTEKGFKETSVLDVVECAHVSKTTFYQFFENKEDLLAGLFQHLVDEVLAEVEAAVKLEKRMAYKALAGIQRYLDLCLQRKSAARLLLVSSVGVSQKVEEVRQNAHLRFAELIQRTVESELGSVRAVGSEDIRTLALAMVGAINEVIIHKIIAPDEILNTEPLARLLNRIVVGSFNMLFMEKPSEAGKP
jgi:AcrR family transcriptional regulator